MHHFLGVMIFTIAVSPLYAQEDTAKRIQTRFEKAKPDAKRLAFYSLDWEMSLNDARKRAAKEKRPILIVLNTNITAGVNFFSGHT